MIKYKGSRMCEAAKPPNTLGLRNLFSSDHRSESVSAKGEHIEFEILAYQKDTQPR